jgi:hypothetical protein
MVGFQAVAGRSKDMPDAERTLRMAIGMLSKAFLHFLPKLHPLPEFPGLWLSILASMEQSMKAARSEEVTEVSATSPTKVVNHPQ